MKRTIVRLFCLILTFMMFSVTFAAGVYGAFGEGDADTKPIDIIIDDDHIHEMTHVSAKEPTVSEEGNIDFYVCETCGRYFKDPEGENEITDKSSVIIPRKSVSFTDVPPESYFADAVSWAVGGNITLGTSETTFSPIKNCTRAQAVTFLWRAAGEPEPSSVENPFSDIKESDYFYNAVLWAVEKEITNGTSADRFSPGASCTRAQIVTFLWRAADKPEPVSYENPFLDVSADYYFYKAVLWAVESEITNGTSGKTFSPNSVCTRAQIVTFLYRLKI